MKRILVFIVAFVFSTSLFSQPCYPDGITFSTQTEIDDFHLLNPDCSEIEGDLTISGDDITNVDSLLSVTSIGGDLSIRYNTDLSSLEGLSNLNQLGGNLILRNNYSLTSFTGLEGINEVFGNCGVAYNTPFLTNLSGLDGIKIIHGNLRINDNYYLINVSGLDSLTTIGGYLQFNLNDRLESLNGLEALHSIGQNCIINENNCLKNIDALSSLTSIQGELAIVENDSLLSISGIENINAESITDLYIYYNPQLPECDVQSICDYLASPNGTTDIYSNASGCNSQEEVETACLIINVPEVSSPGQLHLYPNPASDVVTIKSEMPIIQIAVYSFNGKLIQLEKPHTKSYSLVTSIMAPGTYQLIITTDSGILLERIIIR